jgi:hypothetical protein
MHKQKVINLGVMSLFFVLLSFSFNNCGDVSFAPESLRDSGSEVGPGEFEDLSAEEPASAPIILSNEELAEVIEELSDEHEEHMEVVLDLSQEEYQVIVETIPEEDLDQPRPVTDLIEDPSLYEVYSCGSGGQSVMICHFPENVEAQGTNCVGRSSVNTHFGHTRTYDLGDGPKQITDYLGPCRQPL